MIRTTPAIAFACFVGVAIPGLAGAQPGPDIEQFPGSLGEMRLHAPLGGRLVQGPDGALYGASRPFSSTDPFPRLFRLSSAGAITSVAVVFLDLPLIGGFDGEVYGLSKSGSYSLFRVNPEGGVTSVSDLGALSPSSSTITAMTKAADGSFVFAVYGSYPNPATGALYRWVPGGNLTQIAAFGASSRVYQLLGSPDGSIFGWGYDSLGGTFSYYVISLSPSGDLARIPVARCSDLILSVDGYLYGLAGHDVFKMRTDGGGFTSTTLVDWPSTNGGYGGFLTETRDGTILVAGGALLTCGGEAVTIGGSCTESPNRIWLVTHDLRITSAFDASPVTVYGLGQAGDGEIYGLGFFSYDPYETHAFRLDVPPFFLSSLGSGGPITGFSAIAAGTPTTWTATPTGATPLEYRFWVLSDVGWRIVQDYSQNWLIWTPARAGSYRVQVWSRAVGLTAAWEGYQNSPFFTVTAPAPVSVTSFNVGPLPATTGETALLWAVAHAGVLPGQYQFFVREPGTGWRVLQPWSAAFSVSWTPLAAGDYALQVWVRSAGSTAAYEAWSGVPGIAVAAGPLTVVRLEADRPLPIGVGGTVTWTPTVAGGDGTPLEYQYYRFDVPTGQWILAQPYSSTQTLTWTPGAGNVGLHYVQVWVRRQGSTASYETWAGTSAIDVTTQPLTLTIHSSQGEPPNVPAATPIEWRAVATNATGPLEYMVWRYSVQSTTWSLVQPYGPSDVYAWTPTLADAGLWAVQIWVRRVGSTAAYEAWAGQDFTIQP